MDTAKFIYLKYKDQLHKMIEDETASQTSARSQQFDNSAHQRYLQQYKTRG